jgi:hypothetical protein
VRTATREALSRWRTGFGDSILADHGYKSSVNAKEDLKGKNGIIFLKDCFVRDGEKARVGDHIDLWKRTQPKASLIPGTTRRKYSLGIDMMAPAVLPLVFAAGGAAASDYTPIGRTVAEIAGYTLSLHNHVGGCLLHYSGTAAAGDIKLQIPWPCQFYLDREGEVRTLAVADAEVAVVEHAAPDPESPKDCDTRLHAVRISGRGIRASEYSDRVAACPPFQWDEPVFTGLFE